MTNPIMTSIRVRKISRNRVDRSLHKGFSRWHPASQSLHQMSKTRHTCERSSRELPEVSVTSWNRLGKAILILDFYHMHCGAHFASHGKTRDMTAATCLCRFITNISRRRRLNLPGVQRRNIQQLDWYVLCCMGVNWLYSGEGRNGWKKKWGSMVTIEHVSNRVNIDSE
jgi:hypothetical protein